MSGMYTIAAAAVGSLGLGAYNASQSSDTAGSQLAMQQQTFAEQQQFEQQLAKLIQNPSSVTSTPGYQFQFEQGQQALMRQGAAGGFLGSGNMGAALVQYGQNFASSALTQQENLLAQLSGLAPASPAQYGQNAYQAQQQAFNQQGQLLSSLGFLMGQGGGFGGLFSSGTGGGGALSSGIIDSAGAAGY